MPTGRCVNICTCCQKDEYDQKMFGSPYKVNDLVWLHLPHCAMWSIQEVVQTVITEFVYHIQLLSQPCHKCVARFNRLKPYRGRWVVQPLHRRQKVLPHHLPPKRRRREGTSPGVNLIDNQINKTALSNQGILTSLRPRWGHQNSKSDAQSEPQDQTGMEY